MGSVDRRRAWVPSGISCVSAAGFYCSDRVRAVPDGPQLDIPRIPASAGALIFDNKARLLILKPTYKKGWTIPGGQIDPVGESPWDACRREAKEECGLVLGSGRL